jgi:hypothetical protein
LLLARSVSELTDPAGSLREAAATLAACIQSARGRYGSDDATTGAALTWTTDRFLQRGDAAAAAAVAATARQHLPGWTPPAFGELSSAPGIAVVDLEMRLEQAVHLLDTLTSIGEI